MSFPNKKLFKTIQFLFFFFFFRLVNAAEYTKESLEADTAIGIGIGTLILIIVLVLSGLLCIFGLSTTNPGLFLFLGILIPAVILFFFTVLPSEKKDGSSSDDKERNGYIYIRWFWFVFFLVFVLFTPLLPLFSIWTTQVIPQRVDSRAQKEYDEKYLKRIEEERKKEEEAKEEEDEERKYLNLNENRRESVFNLPVANVRENENKKKYAALRRRRNVNNTGNINDNTGN